MDCVSRWICLVTLMLQMGWVDPKTNKKEENEVLDAQVISISPPPLPSTDLAWETTSIYPPSTAKTQQKHVGRVYPTQSKKFLSPIHGHYWPFDRARIPRRPPVKGSYSVEGTFLWAVGLFGTVENGAIVLTVVCSKKIRKPLHILVGTLGLTDLFISLIYIPSYTYFLLENNGFETDKRKEVISAWSFCIISRAIFVEIASVTLSVKSLIAVYLYIYTCSKETAEDIFTIRNTFLFIFLSWLGNFLILFLPGFMGYSMVDFYPNAFVCTGGGEVTRTESAELTLVYSLATLAVHIGELGIVCICFIKVHRAIKKGRIIAQKNRLDDTQSQLNYVRATKTTILVFVSFCLCWLPIYIINIGDPTHKKFPTDIHRLGMDLLLLKSAVNPLIYIYGIRSLRHEIKLFCMCKCRGKNRKLPMAFPRTSSYMSGKSQSEVATKVSV